MNLVEFRHHKKSTDSHLRERSEPTGLLPRQSHAWAVGGREAIGETRFPTENGLET